MYYTYIFSYVPRYTWKDREMERIKGERYVGVEKANEKVMKRWDEKMGFDGYFNKSTS